MAEYFLGVDLGGTKILTALVDGRGRVMQRARLATPPGGPAAVVDGIVQTVASVTGQAGVDVRAVAGLGVGAPGPMDPETGVVFEPPNLPGWHDVPLGGMLLQRLGVPAHVENDANAAALGERWVGAGAGVDDLVYITVSTGVGGGLIFRGRLYHGVSGTAGEVGHMVIDPSGPPCPCGRHGCLEAMASGPAIALAARAAMLAGQPTSLDRMAPEKIDARAVADAAREGDAVARAVYARAAAALGAGITNLVNLLNPEMIIIGGGVAETGDLIFGPVRRIVKQEAFERPAAAVQIVPAVLGSDAGVVGAAAVAKERS